MDQSRGENGRKVGELAEASGLTVRTLHYYEEIGLLEASGRTPSGHRLYDDADVERLYRVCLLRQLGLPLADIASALDDPAWDLNRAMSSHLDGLDRRMAVEGRLRARLAQLVADVDATDGPATTDLLKLLDEMTVLHTNVQQRIGILVYADIEAMFDEIAAKFGLGPGQLTRDGDGNAVHGEINAGDGVLWLHPESPEFGLSSPRTLGAASATTAIMVDDVDEHFRRASDAGAEIIYQPVDQPYGYREYSARDSEGGLWSFMRLLEGTDRV